MSPIRAVVCLMPSLVLGLSVGATLRVAIPNPYVRALAGIAVMPAVGYAGGFITKRMVEWTEGRIT